MDTGNQLGGGDAEEDENKTRSKGGKGKGGHDGGVRGVRKTKKNREEEVFVGVSNGRVS